jgi:WD40 repeat protein
MEEAMKIDWNRIEVAARVLSLIAIPVVLAVVGWAIQDSLASRNVSQEYVKLAISILKEKKDQVDPSIRDWAADLLNQNSPTKFGVTALAKLKAGDADLSRVLKEFLSSPETSGSALAMSPDGMKVATGHTDGAARIIDLASGKVLKTLTGHTAAVTSLAFYWDAKTLITGSMDGTARIWDVDNATLLRTFDDSRGRGVIGVTFSPDGALALTRQVDGTLNKWDTRTGNLLGTTNIPR